MKHSIKLLLVLAGVLSSASVYAQGEIPQDDQKMIEEIVLCKNTPETPANIKDNSADEKQVDAYNNKISDYVKASEKVLARSSTGKPKKEVIDYSNYTTYQLKHPINIGDISFDKITSVDYEDGYHTFKAARKSVEGDTALVDDFKNPEELFTIQIWNDELVLSCTLAYSY